MFELAHIAGYRIKFMTDSKISSKPFGAGRVSGVCAIIALLTSAWSPVIAADAPANMALVAIPSTSFHSGDTSVSALNDGNNPENSRERGTGSYGNWPHTGTEWVQYEWTQPIATKQIEVYWWMDGQGVGAPKSCRLLYWNGKEFVPVANAQGCGLAHDKFNVTTFDEVRTSKLRLEIVSDGTLSTGVLEWRVLDAGSSPAFPPTAVAGVDRVVILGGKTYLSGAVNSLKREGVKVQWSKASGPGEVTFADPTAIQTSATFSQAGSYVLKLTAQQKGLSAESTLNVRAELPPPKVRLDVVYTKKYSINSPLWSARAKALIVNWIPYCIDQCNRTNLAQGQGGIDNFVEAAKALRGEQHAHHKGYVFANAWVHQTVESMCIAQMVDPQGDPEII